MAIEALGGPVVPFHAGRVDALGSADCPPPGMLPGGHDGPVEIRSTFGRMGFDDREITALLGECSIALVTATRLGDAPCAGV